MLNKQKTYFFISFLLSVVLLASCSNQRRVSKGKPLKNKSAGAILNKYAENYFDFEWLGLKVSADLDDGEKKTSFKANIRVKKDSIIWVSISPALGVEVARLVITPDSLKLLSKVPGDKYYYLGDFSMLTEMAQTDIDFEMVQNLLVGNAIGLEQGEDKYKSRIDDQQYMLISKYNRKLKKVVGTDEKDVEPDDSLEVDLDYKRYQRIKKRTDEEDLLVKRYWFDGIDYRLERSVFDDLYYRRAVIVEHDNFKTIEGQSYPEITRLIISSLTASQTLQIEINRIKTSKEYDFPFEIPKDFERKTNI